MFSASCLSWFRWQGWTGVLTFIIAERESSLPTRVDHRLSLTFPAVILQLRLYALYFRDKRVLVCMSFVCAGTAATSAYVMGAALSSITCMCLPSLPFTRSSRIGILVLTP